MTAFRAYRSKVARSGIVIRTKSGRLCILPSRCKSRYFPEGRSDTRKRLYARFPKSSSEGIFLTLTTDPSAWEDQASASAAIWKKFRVFHQHLRRHLKRKKLLYFAVQEWTKKGWPHLHVFLPGAPFLAPQRDLQKWWGAIVDVRHASCGVVPYIMKYVGKLSKDEHASAVAWASHSRIYNCSRDLTFVIEKRDTDATFLGLVYGDAIRLCKRGTFFTNLPHGSIFFDPVDVGARRLIANAIATARAAPPTPEAPR